MLRAAAAASGPIGVGGFSEEHEREGQTQAHHVEVGKQLVVNTWAQRGCLRQVIVLQEVIRREHVIECVADPKRACLCLHCLHLLDVVRVVLFIAKLEVFDIIGLGVAV